MEADCPVGRYRCAPRGSWLSILNVSFSRQTCRRCPTFEQIARNHDFLHFGCPFIDTQGSNLAIELLDRGPLGDTCPAMDLHRPVDHPLRGFGGKHFCHGRFPGHARGSSVLGPSRAVDQERRRINLACAFRDRGLGHLQFSQWRAEQLARCSPLDALMQCVAGKTERRSAYRWAKNIECCHGYLESLALEPETARKRYA